MKTLLAIYVAGHFSGYYEKYNDYRSCLANRLISVHKDFDTWSLTHDGMKRRINGMDIVVKCEESRTVVVEK